jgi:DNA-binding transcriptional MerR regulator
LDKAPEAFRTISEVADEIDVPQHVLRFWESRFTQIRPMKRGGGRRFYRPEDVDLLRGVRHLLYGEGYTIRGVQRILREQGIGFVQNVWRAGAEQPPAQPDEDLLDDDAEAAASSDAAQVARSLFADRPPRERGNEERTPLRREPTFAPPDPVKPQAAGLGSEARGQLRATLDELVECRRMLDAALAGNDTADSAANGGGRESGADV